MQHPLELFVQTVHAQSLIPASGQLSASCNFVTGNLNFSCIPLYIAYLVQMLLAIAGGFFIFGMMMAGYKYMIGSVTQAGTEAGKKEIIGRIIGFAVIVFSYLIVDTIVRLLT
jgi:hypothetical protein